MTHLLQIDRISRAFAGVPALSDVSFAIEAGTLHALIGENGAGKSTLIKILAGALPPDRGSLQLHGQAYRPRDPRDAQRAGVSAIHQEPNLLPTRSVLVNLMLGHEPTRYGFLDQRQARAAAQRILHHLHADSIPLDAPLHDLTMGQRQLIALARALMRDCRLLIMDEPTAALNSAEAAALFAVLAVLKSRGVTVLYVSHHLAEIFQIADAVTVLRDGQHVRTSPVSAVTPDNLIADMLGRSSAHIFPVRASSPGEVVLSVAHLSSSRAFDDVSFQLRAGEVLAITGLAGSGKVELGRALFGAWPIERGKVRWFDHAVPLAPDQVVAAGAGFMSDDRQQDSLLLDMAVRRNITLAALPRLARRWGFLDRSSEARSAQRHAAALHIKAPSLTAPVRVLSGGNQQKTALAKWLASDARALILLEPTQGIDVGVKFEIYQHIAQLAQAGTALLLISADLAEVAGLADRVLVMRSGKITAELTGRPIDAAVLLRLAAGV